MRIAITLASILLTFSAVGIPTAGAQNLNPQQQQFAKRIEDRLARAEANFRTAQRGIPKNRKPSGAKAKLALVRSASAKSDLKAATDALKNLPSGNTSVQALAKRADDLGRAITAFEKRLTGGAAAPQPSAGKKLDYRDEKRLKDAQFYVREVGGLANDVEALAKQVAAVENKDHIDHRVIAGGAAKLAKGRQRLGFIAEALNELPADGRGVQSTAQAHRQLGTRLDAAEKVLAPVHARLQRIVHPSTYPNLAADTRRIEELGLMCKMAILFDDRPDLAIQMAKDAPAVREELVRVAKTYDLLTRQNVELGKRIAGATRNLHQHHTAFKKGAADQVRTLPGRIDQDLQGAQKMAEQAAREKKPGWFNGGIPQRMGWAAAKVELLEALDETAGKAARARLSKTRAALSAQQESLRDAIIASNELPPDSYKRDDRAAVVARAKAAWLKAQPKAEILGVRIPSEAWTRETMWRLQNRTWYRIDRSKLQVQLLVRDDADTAVMRAVNMWIDHQSGDKRTETLFSTPDQKLPPNFYVLTKKIR